MSNESCAALHRRHARYARQRRCPCMLYCCQRLHLGVSLFASFTNLGRVDHLQVIGFAKRRKTTPSNRPLTCSSMCPSSSGTVLFALGTASRIVMLSLFTDSFSSPSSSSCSAAFPLFLPCTNLSTILKSGDKPSLLASLALWAFLQFFISIQVVNSSAKSHTKTASGQTQSA